MWGAESEVIWSEGVVVAYLEVGPSCLSFSALPSPLPYLPLSLLPETIWWPGSASFVVGLVLVAGEADERVVLSRLAEFETPPNSDPIRRNPFVAALINSEKFCK